jgi:hypothetical protein
MNKIAIHKIIIYEDLESPYGYILQSNGWNEYPEDMLTFETGLTAEDVANNFTQNTQEYYQSIYNGRNNF